MNGLFRAHLLAAEAGDAFCGVDNRQGASHGKGRYRALFHTSFTARAQIFIGFGSQGRTGSKKAEVVLGGGVGHGKHGGAI